MGITSNRKHYHVIMFSGGICSYIAAKRVLAQTNGQNTTLLFCDTKIEDEDLYRFIHEAANRLDCRLIIIRDGRTPWEVFTDERYIGNHHVDPCSKLLKRQLARRWVKENCDPAATTLYLGLDWQERHRVAKSRQAWLPWTTTFPALERPLLDHCGKLAAVIRDGLRPPRLYELGFPHNNCGGFCVKAGKAAFRHLLRILPDRYLQHEHAEKALRATLGTNVTILTETRGGQKIPLTLEAWRLRCQANPKHEENEEWGGCGCFLDPDDAELADTQ